MQEELEKLMDSKGLDTVLYALDQICVEKAAHIADTWQDSSLAKRWQHMGGKIATLAREAEGL